LKLRRTGPGPPTPQAPTGFAQRRSLRCPLSLRFPWGLWLPWWCCRSRLRPCHGPRSALLLRPLAAGGPRLDAAIGSEEECRCGPLPGQVPECISGQISRQISGQIARQIAGERAQGEQCTEAEQRLEGPRQGPRPKGVQVVKAAVERGHGRGQGPGAESQPGQRRRSQAACVRFVYALVFAERRRR